MSNYDVDRWDIAYDVLTMFVLLKIMRSTQSYNIQEYVERRGYHWADKCKIGEK